MARLKPGVSLAQAQAAASLVFRNEVLYGPEPFAKPADDPEVLATRAQEGLVGERGQIAKMLYVLMFAVGIVLLIACAQTLPGCCLRAPKRDKERLRYGRHWAQVVRQFCASF